MFVFADTSTPFPKFIVQVYLPESAERRKGMLLDNVYSVKDFISVADDDAITVPCGPFHTVLTSFETFTSDLSSAVQVKVSVDPDNTGLGELKQRLTVGSGAVKEV